MKILAIIICGQNPEDDQTYILKEEYCLDSVGYLMRGTVKGSFKFVCRNSMQEVDPGTRHRIKQDEHFAHIQVGMDAKCKIAAYAFCDAEYPSRVVQDCLRQCLEAFQNEVGPNWVKQKADQNIKCKKIEQNLIQYQDPKNFDKLMMLEESLDNTKEILHENLEKMLARQGDLDKLAAKSNDLNVAAKHMYKQSKKTNKSCCVIF